MATKQNKKFTEEELTELKSIRKSFNDVSFKLGQLEMQKLNLDAEKQLLVEVFNKTITQEKKIAGELLTKYGKGTIDIDSGEFISAS